MDMDTRIKAYAAQPAQKRNAAPGYAIFLENGEVVRLTPRQNRRIDKKINREGKLLRQEIADLTTPDQAVEVLKEVLQDAITEAQEKILIRELTDVSDGPRATLETKTRDDLRKIAAEHEIRGRGAMNKAQLIEAILEVHGE